MSLKDKELRSQKHSSKKLRDGAVIGLYSLPPSKCGNRPWQLRYVSPVTHKRRDMGLGVYPEVSLAQARELARKARNLIAEGNDPIDGRRDAKTSEVQRQSHGVDVVTFKSAAVAFHQTRKPSWSNGKHAQQWIKTLELYAFPTIGNKDVATLKPSDFERVLRPIWHDKKETANRVKQRCFSVMQYCVAKEYIPQNPLVAIQTILPPRRRNEVNHFPAMDWRKIPQFVNDELHTSTADSSKMIEFLILTAARSSEVKGAKWDEIDFAEKAWTIPASRMKANRPHVIPLCERALEILQSQKEKHSVIIFPTVTGKIACDSTLTKFLKDHDIRASNGKYATAHGFRSSFRDWLSDNEYPAEIAERALAHAVRNKTEAAYNRTDLFERRRPMMEKWGDYCCKKC